MSGARCSGAWRARLALPLACLAVWACGGVRVQDQKLPAGLAWPPGDERVRLERLVAARRSGSLLGAKQAPLFEAPYAVAWQGDDLLVTDTAAHRVSRIAADGRLSVSPDDVAELPMGIAVCAAGIVVTDAVGGRVALLGSDLKRRRFIAEGLDRPTGVACSGDTVWVVETGAHRLLAIEPAGRRTFGARGGDEGHFNYPTSIAVSGETVFVGDTLNFRVQRLDALTGASLGAFGGLGDAAGDMPRLKGVAVDAFGNLWVADAHLDRVSLYAASGELLMSLGRTGSEPGEFSFPAGIATHHDGKVAVVDSLNRRVQVFRVVRREGTRP